ncbi:putative protein N-methyltransferase FAM86B1 isoform X7 [Homo sapiens]|uniref:putative protein N-methyltransferase FAM86B1 isoform X7 n=1 Tax=Homo sapiens TaxID=9606 RepID=UPI0005D0085B|nr:putative protein N-methyltransferase FAM86B1 isoform X7 [Homo sapiens]XP_024303081.1 putative protein N-methyltransferase FAM86B1 isoform X7 [Homo sapiens]XP_024303082.1 putative protein N-methyltransferase FAM86B1 isoform X7 [Homo sapiens]|eukprot:XP_011542144.1 putative protein N-methyltransferase FAM86B1 isoform X6 [Homo sapiens]
MPGAFSQNSSKSPQEAQSHSPRAQPSSPTVPQAWSHGMPPSTLQNGPSRTRQPSLTGDLGAQGRAPRQAYPGAVENTVPFPPARTVLELGSGAGLTGLAICKMCRPRAYIFSDPHSRVLEQLRGNVLLNGLSLEADITGNLDSPRVTVAQLDWDVAMVHQLSAFQPDVVIAADVLYCPEAIVSLVGVLQRLAACREHKRAPEVYVAFTVRNPETCQLFTTELGEPPRPPGPTWCPSCPCRTPVEVKELGAGEKLGCSTLPHYAGNSGRGRPGWDQMGSGSSS